MLGMIELLLHWLTSLVKSRRRLEAENPVLRHVPISRPIERFGCIIAEPMVGGLHHRYARI
jgi:hypothetical protein